MTECSRCLGMALYAASFLGRAFLPDFNEGALTISAPCPAHRWQNPIRSAAS